MKEWAKPVNDVIHVPDELDPLINRIAMQVKFHTVSRRFSEEEMICRIAAVAQEFFEKLHNVKAE
jgi:hypothetical protein